MAQKQQRPGGQKRAVGEADRYEDTPDWYIEEGFETATVVLGSPDNAEAPRVHLRAVPFRDMLALQGEGDSGPSSTAAVNVLTRGIASWTLTAGERLVVVVRDGEEVYDPWVAAEGALAEGETLAVVCEAGEPLPVPTAIETEARRKAVVFSLSTRAYNRIFSGLGFLSRD